MENKFRRKCTFLIDDHYVTEIVYVPSLATATVLMRPNIRKIYKRNTHTHKFILASFLIAICPFSFIFDSNDMYEQRQVLAEKT